MKFLYGLWRCWTLLCVAFCTTAVILGLVYGALHLLAPAKSDQQNIAECLESGGTWDDGVGVCKTAA